MRSTSRTSSCSKSARLQTAAQRTEAGRRPAAARSLAHRLPVLTVSLCLLLTLAPFLLLLQVVGKGGFGKVRLRAAAAALLCSAAAAAHVCLPRVPVLCQVNAITALLSQELLALKRMEKSRVLKSKTHLTMVWTERKIMSLVTSPFLCHLRHAFESDTELFLVMPFLQGGDLRFHLRERGRMSEATARFYAAEMLLGLQDLHSKRIVYRDLKPENLLLDDQGHLQITDFGLAFFLQPEDGMRTRGQAGTRGYMAPETLSLTGYGLSVDFFSFGVVLYELLHGRRPWRSIDANMALMGMEGESDPLAAARLRQDEQQLEQREPKAADGRPGRRGVEGDGEGAEEDEDEDAAEELRFSSRLSTEARSLLLGLLEFSPAKRLGATGGWAEVKRQPFFASLDWAAMESRSIKPPFTPDVTHANCFVELDTRVLTSCGLLFLDQIEALQRAGTRLLFGCYDAQTQALLYSRGRLVFPQRPPPYLVEFTSPGEDARWAEGSGDYGTEGAAEDSSSSRHVSLRVTPGHAMFVQLGRARDVRGLLRCSRTTARRGSVRSSPPAVPQPHRKVQAQDLLSADARAYLRMLACAEAGYEPQATSRRRAVQRDLHLNDRQFAAFIELLGFWLGDGSLAIDSAVNGSARGYVTFSQVKQADLSWLRSALKQAGLKEDEHWLSGDSGRQTALRITQPAWLAFFAKEFGGKSVKQLPGWALQELSAAEMRLLISGLQRADGEQLAGAVNVIHTPSAPFRDQLMQALLHCGYSAHAGLMHRKGAIRGYSFHDQSNDTRSYSADFFAGLGAEEQLKYRPTVASADAWRVSWAEVSPEHSTPAAAGSCWPSMSRQQCVSKVAYDAQRDGRVWCVQVEHPDHLIIAQRAQRSVQGPDTGTDTGTVTKQSRPLVVGNCTPDADLADQLLDKKPKRIREEEQKAFRGWSWNTAIAAAATPSKPATAADEPADSQRSGSWQPAAQDKGEADGAEARTSAAESAPDAAAAGRVEKQPEEQKEREADTAPLTPVTPIAMEDAQLQREERAGEAGGGGSSGRQRQQAAVRSGQSSVAPCLLSPSAALSVTAAASAATGSSLLPASSSSLSSLSGSSSLPLVLSSRQSLTSSADHRKSISAGALSLHAKEEKEEPQQAGGRSSLLLLSPHSSASSLPSPSLQTLRTTLSGSASAAASSAAPEAADSHKDGKERRSTMRELKPITTPAAVAGGGEHARTSSTPAVFPIG